MTDRNHQHDDMNDSMDGYIRGCLKNWTIQEHPPSYLRTRLLFLAASPVVQQTKRPTYKDNLGTLLDLLSSEYMDREQEVEPFKHSWLLVLHSTLSPLRHLP